MADDAPRLLAGGNPQIPKGDGDAPVRAYIAAMPGWKRAVGEQLDALIERTVPDVQRFVRWNQPMYAVEDQGYIVSFRCFTSHVKVTFFAGAQLEPVPPVDFKAPKEKAFRIHEGEDVDEELFTRWVSQASRLPGWVP